MRRVSMATRDELLTAVSERYRASVRAEKFRIVEEFAVRRRDIIASTRCVCFVPARPANVPRHGPRGDIRRRRARGADCSVGSVGPSVWQALKAIIPTLIEAMVRHGHLALGPQCARRVHE